MDVTPDSGTDESASRKGPGPVWFALLALVVGATIYALVLMKAAQKLQNSGEVEYSPNNRWTRVSKNLDLQQAIDVNDGPEVKRLLHQTPRAEISNAAIELLANDVTDHALDAFLGEGWDPMGFAHNGRPLVSAIEEGQEKAATILVAHGADPNVNGGPDGGPPILVAVTSGVHSEKMTRFLLDLGVKPMIKLPPSGGVQPLTAAIRMNHPESALLLLEHGADVNFIPHWEKQTGAPALIECASGNHPSAFVKLLLAHGADPNLQGISHYTNPYSGKQTTLKGSPLYFHAAQDNAQALQLLLAAGADPERRASNGSLPVDVAQGACLEILKKATKR